MTFESSLFIFMLQVKVFKLLLFYFFKIKVLGIFKNVEHKCKFNIPIIWIGISNEALATVKRVCKVWMIPTLNHCSVVPLVNFLSKYVSFIHFHFIYFI